MGTPEDAGGRKKVRFSSEALLKYKVYGDLSSHKGSLKDISTSGVLFEAGSPPKKGSICDIAISFSQGKETVRATVEVARVISKGEGYQVAARFAKISREDLEKIDSLYLNKRLREVTKGATSVHWTERRKSDRFSVRGATIKSKKKRLLHFGPWKDALIKDISPSGIRIITSFEHMRGEVWKVLMKFAPYPDSIKAVAEVMWVKPLAKSGYSVGLRFSKISEAEKRKLTESSYTKELLSKSDGTIGNSTF